MKRAIFPGTFDPFTIGHYNIVMRGLGIFDEIIVAVGVNQLKKTLFDVEKRIEIIERAYVGETRVKTMTYETLTVDFARTVNANYILRGIRSVSDFEYEHTIANTNKKLIGIETVILFTDTEHSFISSTILRDLISYGKDVSAFLPPNVHLPL